MEAADFGVRLCQQARRSVGACYLLAAVPVVALAILSYQIANWLPAIVIWWAKPWLDQSILFALSRAAFGQQTTASVVKSIFLVIVLDGLFAVFFASIGM